MTGSPSIVDPFLSDYNLIVCSFLNTQARKVIWAYWFIIDSSMLPYNCRFRNAPIWYCDFIWSNRTNAVLFICLEYSIGFLHRKTTPFSFTSDMFSIGFNVMFYVLFFIHVIKILFCGKKTSGIFFCYHFQYNF